MSERTERVFWEEFNAHLKEEPTPEREMCTSCGLKYFPSEWPSDCINEDCPSPNLMKEVA